MIFIRGNAMWQHDFEFNHSNLVADFVIEIKRNGQVVFIKNRFDCNKLIAFNIDHAIDYMQSCYDNYQRNEINLKSNLIREIHSNDCNIKQTIYDIINRKNR